MSSTAKVLKLFSDVTRLRILMLINRRELCVCQIMGILGISQPLVSRNLAILNSSGIIKERKAGKLIFYSMNAGVPDYVSEIIEIITKMTESEEIFQNDMQSLRECEDFQKNAGRCDMKTFKDFMAMRSKRLPSSCRRYD